MRRMLGSWILIAALAAALGGLWLRGYVLEETRSPPAEAR
jgi:hypothetical protein